MVKTLINIMLTQMALFTLITFGVNKGILKNGLCVCLIKVLSITIVGLSLYAIITV